MRIRPGRHCLIGLLGMAVLAGCGGPPDQPAAGPTTPAPAPSLAEPTELPGEPGPPPAAAARPDWLGTQVLPVRPDGLGEVRDTPPELVDRGFPPPAGEPVPDRFVAEIEPVPAEVAARSTWVSECPVTLDDLRYVTMTFWGFDGRTYPGELIVHRRVASDVVSVFERLYEARFPIEEMRVVPRAELDAPPTGDGNNTTGFVCRPTTLAGSWSQHAYGLAIDINPFHNPYRRGDAVLPELASAYLDRDHHRPGMIQPGDPVTEAFSDIGWGWGGEWANLDDWMHFSQSGR